MKAYKLEVLVIDFDDLSEQGIVKALENANFANDCMSPQVMKIQEADIGEWDDSHPLNNTDTMNTEYNRIFSEGV